MLAKKRWRIECSEKYKSFKLKIPQPDSERRHSPDFRTVFGIMIGPFSSCEIGKTWDTNKQVNKQTNKNWKFQFPQPDYQPRHSPDFRTVFGIMIGPFSFCEIGKRWGTNNQVNKQTNKNWKFQYPQPDLESRQNNEQILFYTFFGEVHFAEKWIFRGT